MQLAQLLVLSSHGFPKLLCFGIGICSRLLQHFFLTAQDPDLPQTGSNSVNDDGVNCLHSSISSSACYGAPDLAILVTQAPSLSCT